MQTEGEEGRDPLAADRIAHVTFTELFHPGQPLPSQPADKRGGKGEEGGGPRDDARGFDLPREILNTPVHGTPCGGSAKWSRRGARMRVNMVADGVIERAARRTARAFTLDVAFTVRVLSRSIPP